MQQVTSQFHQGLLKTEFKNYAYTAVLRFGIESFINTLQKVYKVSIRINNFFSQNPKHLKGSLWSDIKSLVLSPLSVPVYQLLMIYGAYYPLHALSALSYVDSQVQWRDLKDFSVHMIQVKSSTSTVMIVMKKPPLFLRQSDSKWVVRE
jgi:hypothetical protein